MKKEYYYIDGLGEFYINVDDVDYMAQQGACDSYVDDCLSEYTEQFSKIETSKLLEAVESTGAESYSKESTREELISFLIWMGSWDIREEREA